MSFLDKMNKRGLGRRTCLRLLTSRICCSACGHVSSLWCGTQSIIVCCLVIVSCLCISWLNGVLQPFLWVTERSDCPLHSVLKQEVQPGLTAEGQCPVGQLSPMAWSHVCSEARGCLPHPTISARKAVTSGHCDHSVYSARYLNVEFLWHNFFFLPYHYF